MRHFLELCLKSVYSATVDLDAEIIVVDNNSPDNSSEMVTSLFPEVILIDNKENLGFSKANNQGVAIAQGEYICILNPDTVVSETTFHTLYNFAQSDDTIGAIGPRLIDGTGRFLPECKRNLPTPSVAFQKVFGSGNRYYARNVDHKSIGKVPILVGAFMFMKRAIYEEVGGFDESYFMYGEDIDLSHTITKAGYHNYYYGETTVIHFKGESTAKDQKYRKRFYGAMHIFYNKHLKRNALESFMVRLGLWFATLSRKHMSIPIIPKPKKYFLFSDNMTLQNAITQKINETTHLLTEDSEITEGSQVFLDLNTHTHGRCIDMIENSQNSDVTFKFIPKNSTFAIGSNCCEGRGEIICLQLFH